MNEIDEEIKYLLMRRSQLKDIESALPENLQGVEARIAMLLGKKAALSFIAGFLLVVWAEGGYNGNR
jgi:hypothetical protein